MKQIDLSKVLLRCIGICCAVLWLPVFVLLLIPFNYDFTFTKSLLMAFLFSSPLALVGLLFLFPKLSKVSGARHYLNLAFLTALLVAGCTFVGGIYYMWREVSDGLFPSITVILIVVIGLVFIGSILLIWRFTSRVPATRESKLQN